MRHVRNRGILTKQGTDRGFLEWPKTHARRTGRTVAKVQSRSCTDEKGALTRSRIQPIRRKEKMAHGV
ncbi:hypothetical protein I3843_11G191900 [Carya illinoinensis]|nr:hypothetical protein I3843_11G191900 [Carya illinoinensis]